MAGRTPTQLDPDPAVWKRTMTDPVAFLIKLPVEASGRYLRVQLRARPRSSRWPGWWRRVTRSNSGRQTRREFDVCAAPRHKRGMESTIQLCVDGDVATPRIFHGAALV